MLAYETMLLFLGTTMLLCLMPAADNTLVFTQSAFQGHMAGIAVTLGFCTGLMAQVAGVVVGLAVIIKSSTTFFNLLKAAGTLYLAYVAWQAFKLKPKMASQSSHASLLSLYGRGALMNILNPMVPLFLMVYYSPFVKAELGTASEQLIQLGILNIVAAFCVFGALSFLGEKVGEKFFRNEKIQRIIRYSSSFIIAGTAIILLVQ